MNWMFESRSKSYEYDDGAEGGSYSPPLKWHDVLLFPVAIILFLLYSVVMDVLLIPLGIILSDFSATVKRTSESGKLEFPNLVFIGIGIAIILPILIGSGLFDVSVHPFITFCFSVFVLIFAVAPLTGLASRHFKQK